jgi:HK97 family phage portal protein
MSEVAAAIEDRVTPADEPGHAGVSRDWFVLEQLAREDGGEVRVNAQTALTYSAYWACVRIISQSIASLGWHVFESRGARGKDRVYDDVSWILDTQTNPEMSAFDFRQVLIKDALTWGNGYAEIERDGFGRVKWMYRLAPDRVEVLRDDGGRLYYEIDNGYSREPTRLGPEQVYHLKGLGPDGLVGYSVVAMFRRTISQAINVGRYGDSFFRKGPMPGGVLKVPGLVDKNRRDELREDMHNVYGGSKNAGKVLVLFGGMEFDPLSMPNTDAQFLESQRFSVEEMARIFGVPPHKLADLTRSTNNNIEHQAIEFVQDCLLPWCRRLETEADLKLYGRQLRGRRWTRLNLQALLRGDSATQVRNLQTLTTSGIATINEAREHLDYNPIEGGDTPLVQGAMVPLELALNPPDPATPAPAPKPAGKDEGGGDDDMPENLRAVFAPLLANVYDRLLRVEADKARRADNKGVLPRHVANHYTPDVEAHAADQLAPVLSALLLASGRPGDPAPLAARLARDHVRRSVDDLSHGVTALNVWGLLPGSPAARAAQQAEAHLSLAWEAVRTPTNGVHA